MMGEGEGPHPTTFNSLSVGAEEFLRGSPSPHHVIPIPEPSLIRLNPPTLSWSDESCELIDCDRDSVSVSLPDGVLVSQRREDRGAATVGVRGGWATGKKKHALLMLSLETLSTRTSSAPGASSNWIPP